MPYQVRRVTAGDWREYRRLRLESLRDSPSAFSTRYDEAVLQPDEFWQQRVEGAATGPATCMFVAAAGEDLVGTVTCLVEPEVTGYVSTHIVGMYVAPRFRGRTVAVSERLLTAAIGWARQDAGADRILLFVHETNARATAFYRRTGFVETGVTVSYPPDPSYTEHEMEHRAGGLSPGTGQ